MSNQKKNVLRSIKEWVLITLGIVIYTSGWAVFLTPNNLIGGGVSGISAILQYATGIKMGYTYFVINAALLIISLFIIGPSFGMKTVFAIFLASFCLNLFQSIIPAQFIQDFSLSNGKLMCSIIGGGMAGLGIGMSISQGGSTGGTDIIALIVNKYRNISPGKVILICDVFIISSSYVVLTHLESAQRVETMVYGFVTMAIQAYTLDAILSGNKQSVQIFIFSRHFDSIADQITESMRRGVTVIDGTGWYTKENQKVIITMVRKNEISDVYRIIKSIDKTAFLTVANVMGVYGKGFEELKR